MRIQITRDVFRAHIRLILIQVWDPIGVKRFMSDSGIVEEDDDLVIVHLQPMKHKEIVLGDMESEYDNYIPGLESLILDKASAKDIYEYLRKLEVESMEREVDDDVRRSAAMRLHLIGVGSEGSGSVE
jgi:hypothetical protein